MSWIRDLIGLAGVAAIAVGLAIVHPSLPWLAVGGLMTWLAVAASRAATAGEKHKKQNK